ncbi:MAG: hypothetical protein LAP87_00530 [Acidobacteriia bacterium]|nr:hypothetical protein [Terriglobia bacterium]
MTSIFKSAAGMRMAFLGLVCLTAASATVIDISTVAGNGWTITGAGATGAAPMFLSDAIGGISVSSDSLSTGTFITGGSLAAFDGFWVANLTFTLPTGATAPSLNITGFRGDDRAVLELNGNPTPILNVGVSGSTGAGLMQFTDGGATTPFTFNASTFPATGTFTTGFVTGLNTLTIIVNNTSAGGIGAATGTLTPGDGTRTLLGGNFTFTPAAVPEPATASFLILGLAPLAWVLRKQRSR